MKKATLLAVLLIMPLSFASLAACAAGFTWDDVPVYPGAIQVSHHDWFDEDTQAAFEERWDIVEWRCYRFNRGRSKEQDLYSYYVNEMTQMGWELILTGSKPLIFTKNNDNNFAAVYIYFFPSEHINVGDTEMVLVRASGPK